MAIVHLFEKYGFNDNVRDFFNEKLSMRAEGKYIYLMLRRTPIFNETKILFFIIFLRLNIDKRGDNFMIRHVWRHICLFLWLF